MWGLQLTLQRTGLVHLIRNTTVEKEIYPTGFLGCVKHPPFSFCIPYRLEIIEQQVTTLVGEGRDVSALDVVGKKKMLRALSKTP